MPEGLVPRAVQIREVPGQRVDAVDGVRHATEREAVISNGRSRVPTGLVPEVDPWPLVGSAGHCYTWYRLRTVAQPVAVAVCGPHLEVMANVGLHRCEARRGRPRNSAAAPSCSCSRRTRR